MNSKETDEEIKKQEKWCRKVCHSRNRKKVPDASWRLGSLRSEQQNTSIAYLRGDWCSKCGRKNFCTDRIA